MSISSSSSSRHRRPNFNHQRVRITWEVDIWLHSSKWTWCPPQDKGKWWYWIHTPHHLSWCHISLCLHLSSIKPPVCLWCCLTSFLSQPFRRVSLCDFLLLPPHLRGGLNSLRLSLSPLPSHYSPPTSWRSVHFIFCAFFVRNKPS